MFCLLRKCPCNGKLYIYTCNKILIKSILFYPCVFFKEDLMLRKLGYHTIYIHVMLNMIYVDISCSPIQANKKFQASL